MRKIILLIAIVFIYSISFAQEGTEHKITKIIGAKKVEINAGEQFRIKVDDIFQVFGEAQEIHPATGKLVKSDNVYLGKIKVIKVNELSSVARQIEKDNDFSVGNKIVKITSETLPVVEEKKPLEGQFENQEERNYDETIYSHKTNKDVHIIKINDSNNQTIATIDKGNKTKTRGGSPVVNKKYYVFVPIVYTPSITGNQTLTGQEIIGTVKLTEIEHDASKGVLTLNKKTDYSFIDKDNLLRTYVPKLKGWHHIVRLNFLSFNYIDNKQQGEIEDEKMFSPLNGFEFINGYRFSPVYTLGGGLGYNVEYHQPYIDAKINNIPLFIHQRFNLFNKYKSSMSFNLSLGKNFVLNSTHIIRPYSMYGSDYLSGGIGYKSYIQHYGAFIIDLDFELKRYMFYNYYDNQILLYMLKLKIGFELNYSPLN